MKKKIRRTLNGEIEREHKEMSKRRKERKKEKKK